MLRGGRGASFTVQPAAGVLEPFSEEIIEVTSFCDMWGDYTDQLICNVENMEPVFIPMKLGVVGSPLNFQIVAQKSGQIPILRFGTHVSGVAPVTRQMRINNSSPVDIRLDWEVFNVEESDNQLLDMVVNFGDLFPILDAQGNPVQPGGQKVAKRQLTGIIPNTPVTTPGTSSEDANEASTIETAPSTAGNVESRPNIISVVVREHGGKQSNNPFMIQPSQVVVPARGNTSLNVSFTPFPTSDISHTVDCSGYALGYASLERPAHIVEGKVCRKQHYDINPLRLDMTAQVKPALLTIECTDEDAMYYRAAASDLMKGGQEIVPESLKMCSAVLSNHTETPLVFRLLSSEPFQIVYTDPDTQAPILQLLQTEMASLNPRQNMLVQVGFRISLELLERISCWNKDAEEDHTKTWELELHGQERRIHFTDQLLIEFNNKSTQKLPLAATLILPSLVISKEIVDFGTCLVGQPREMQFTLENPSASASYWTVTIESRSDTCEEDTFRIEPSEGTLEPFITHVSNSKTQVKVFFTAKHTEDYEAVFLVQGLLGEEPRRLQLRGSGSYDGKHEALVNV